MGGQTQSRDYQIYYMDNEQKQEKVYDNLPREPLEVLP